MTSLRLISFPTAMIPSIGESTVILLSLTILFAVSWVMFGILSRRSTSDRYFVTLGEWGRERGVRLMSHSEDCLPAPLDTVTTQRLQSQICLGGRQLMLIQFQSFNAAGPPAPGETRVREGLWNLLVREIETPWPPTGLRPTVASASVLDLFSLSGFPLLGASERFVVYGTLSKAANSLTQSSARGLLPPDIGLLLHGRSLVLDFSDRPFDTIEFDRMIAVAEQIVSHLPSPDATEE